MSEFRSHSRQCSLTGLWPNMNVPHTAVPRLLSSSLRIGFCVVYTLNVYNSKMGLALNEKTVVWVKGTANNDGQSLMSAPTLLPTNLILKRCVWKHLLDIECQNMCSVCTRVWHRIYFNIFIFISTLRITNFRSETNGPYIQCIKIWVKNKFLSIFESKNKFNFLRFFIQWIQFQIEIIE